MKTLDLILLLAVTASFNASAVDCDEQAELAKLAAEQLQQGVSVQELLDIFPGDDLQSKINRSVIKIVERKAKTQTAENIGKIMLKQCKEDVSHIM